MKKKKEAVIAAIAFAAAALSTAGTLTITNSGSALKGYYLNKLLI